MSDADVKSKKDSGSFLVAFPCSPIATLFPSPNSSHLATLLLLSGSHDEGARRDEGEAATFADRADDDEKRAADADAETIKRCL